MKQGRLNQLKLNFNKNIFPQLKTDIYKNFAQSELNNAKLLAYETYVRDLDDFAKLYEALNRDFHKFLAACKNLESASDPNQQLKSLYP